MPAARPAVLPAALIATLLGACAPSEAPVLDAAPTVLLVTLDPTRADRIGCYGHAGARTPMIDALVAAVRKGATVSPAEAGKRVKARGYKTTSKTFGVQVASALANDKRFKKVGRGQYQLVGGKAPAKPAKKTGRRRRKSRRIVPSHGRDATCFNTVTCAPLRCAHDGRSRWPRYTARSVLVGCYATIGPRLSDGTLRHRGDAIGEGLGSASEARDGG